MMLIMSLLARLAGPSAADLVADDLAIMVSIALVLVGSAYVRFGPR
jgi:hypothetical protein